MADAGLLHGLTLIQNGYDFDSSLNCGMSKPRSSVIVTLLTPFSLAYTTPAFAGDASVSWDTNIEPNLAGNKVCYGIVSGSYGTSIDVGKQINYIVTGLRSETYCNSV